MPQPCLYVSNTRGVTVEDVAPVAPAGFTRADMASALVEGSLMQVAEQDAREGFRRIDKDNDGLISGSDLVEAIRGYYFDESADSPGHWLIGPLDP